MFFQEDSTNDRIEETRELLYKIIKEFPSGIASTFLEQLYNERYVKTSMANSLPTNWLALLRVAEEFHVQDVSTYSLLFLSNGNIAKHCEYEIPKADSSSPSMLSETEEVGKSDKFERNDENKILAPISNFMSDQFEPVPLDSLPNGGPIEITIISALDPGNIFFRFKKWNIYCEYLSSALSRLPQTTFDDNFLPGQVFGTQIDGDWCRVKIINKSTANPQYWVVYVLDAGFYYAVHRMALRPLTEAVTAFKKTFLAQCKLDGICVRGQNQKEMEVDINKQLTDRDENGHWHRVQWLPETQHFVNEALQSKRLKGKLVELLTNDWKLHTERTIPVCTGKLLIDSTDFGEQLVSMGLAQRK
ncbi:hypothetical protein ACQ4LE_009998 [Meloidogyne hapla]|uniref:Tudor domain-containing protein n=1 Tax=Meloidogyne hapla TaxID=6305 RepID=A0A1I8BM16_MELHA